MAPAASSATANAELAVRLGSAGERCRIAVAPTDLLDICHRLVEGFGCVFASLIAEEEPGPAWSLIYAFLSERGAPLVELAVRTEQADATPSISGLVYAADWHEREVKDLFGLRFSGHPQLGEFILHEDWPEGVNPMRPSFDPRRLPRPREAEPEWKPPTIVEAPGAFTMPVGPVFSDFAEAAHFRLETVGEDVIHTIPRFFYKYRGVEKLAEGKRAEDALLLAERFSGNSAFAHGLAFCQAVEAICGVEVPPRARALRTALAELERLRHHAAAIAGICASTALAVAAAQAQLIEERLLRLSAEAARHRYLFGALRPGGLAFDMPAALGRRVAGTAETLAGELDELHKMLRYSSSFLDRLEEVGAVRLADARSYGLVGPVARASGLGRDIRKLLTYAAYDQVDFVVPVEGEGDGYARLRVLFAEAEQSAAILRQVLAHPPTGPVLAEGWALSAGTALAAVEAPLGAAFHWLRLDSEGRVRRYRIAPPSFANWHGFHLAAENFAFQDFPIILASFGLSNAECDR